MAELWGISHKSRIDNPGKWQFSRFLAFCLDKHEVKSSHKHPPTTWKGNNYCNMKGRSWNVRPLLPLKLWISSSFLVDIFGSSTPRCVFFGWSSRQVAIEKLKPYRLPQVQSPGFKRFNPAFATDFLIPKWLGVYTCIYNIPRIWLANAFAIICI